MALLVVVVVVERYVVVVSRVVIENRDLIKVTRNVVTKRKYL